MANAPPNLGDVITQADVSTKGAGSYAADYVSWARVAHLLHVHAPGWQFHLRPTADGSHVWQAPNGTAYVCGFFVGPDGDQTPLFPQAVMDNRNAPVAFAKVSARDLTDTHRRCLCTAAAATFGLAWQLWAKEPLEDPHRPAPPSHAELVAAARKACLAAGLTPDGITALVNDASNGAATRLEDLPAELLQRLARAGVSPETVARCNAAAEALVTPVDEEPPARWQEPVAAAA